MPGLCALKWTGSIVMIGGVALLAANVHLSGWGFVPYFFGSSCWLAAGIWMREPSIVAVNAAMIVNQAVGIYRWLVV